MHVRAHAPKIRAYKGTHEQKERGSNFPSPLHKIGGSDRIREEGDENV